MMSEDAGGCSGLLTDTRLRLRVQCGYADGKTLGEIAVERELTLWQVAEACFGSGVCKPRKEDLRWEQLGGPDYQLRSVQSVGYEQYGEKMRARREERDRATALDLPSEPATWSAMWRAHQARLKRYEIAEHFGVSLATVGIAFRWFGGGRDTGKPHPMRDRVLALYKEGYTLKDIEARLGCSWITALFIARDAGVLLDKDVPDIAREPGHE